MASLEQELRRHALIDSRAAGLPEFRLRSGQKSRYFLDLKVTCQDPRWFGVLGRLLARLTAPLSGGESRVALAAPAVGGILPAMSLARARYDENTGHWPVLVVRPAEKARGLAERITGTRRFPPPGRVLVVEDVVTEGSTSLDCVDALLEAGYEAVGVVAVADRQQGARERLAARGLPFWALTTLEGLLWTEGGDGETLFPGG